MIIGQIKYDNRVTYKHFIIPLILHPPPPRAQPPICTSVPDGSIVWAWGRRYVLLGGAPFKAPTHHSKFNINISKNIYPYSIFKISPKSPAESLLEIFSLPKQVMVMRRHRLLQRDFSRCCLESVPLNKTTELIQKGSPASYRGMEKRETAATQTFPVASFLSRLDKRRAQQSGAFLCSSSWGGGTDETEKGHPPPLPA